MADKAAVATATKSHAGWMTGLRLGIFLFLLIRLANFVFNGWWTISAFPDVKALLQTAQMPNLEFAISYVYATTLYPLIMTLLAVLAPLFGWWVYSRVEPEHQSTVGWSGALIFSVCDAILTIVSTPDHVVGYIGLAISEAIAILWIMFFMGIGFNIAKLFKAKL